MNMTSLITDHIDVWTTAITPKVNAGRGRGNNSNGQTLHGIKKLRELILELAVRGKLVPQDPSDEPAKVLLEKITKEKGLLIKKGEIKKQKPLPEIEDEEIIFQLPRGWAFVRLGDITNRIGSGSTPRGGKSAYVEKGIPFLRSQNVWNDGLNLSEVAYIPHETHQKMSNTVVLPNDVLLNITGASLGRCTIYPDGIGEANVSQHVTIIRPTNESMRFFLHTCLLSPYGQNLIWGRQVGMAREGLSKKVLELFEIPTPPLAEQHRIVAKVDELMALCDQLEQQQTNNNETHQLLVETLLTSLTQATDQDDFTKAWQSIADHFDTLFITESSIDQIKQTIIELAINGKLIKFENGWEKLLVKDLLTFGPRNGLSPKEASYETKVKVLKLGATTKGLLDLNESKFVDIEIEEDSHLWIRDGDILIQRGNAAQYVGCNVVVTGKPSDYIYPDLMMKLRTNDRVYPHYLSLCLSALSSRKYMWGKMTGTSGTMPKISKKVVESIPLIIPDLETQRDVFNMVNRLIHLTDSLKNGLHKLNTTQIQLTDAIVEKALAQA